MSKFILAGRGRELYPQSVDKFRFIMPSVGESTTCKTLMEDVMQELYMDNTKVFIVTPKSSLVST
eukprot:COSAG01_NODE_4072_length_5381_cov_5.718856_4_plen_65_part_00